MGDMRKEQNFPNDSQRQWGGQKIEIMQQRDEDI